MNTDAPVNILEIVGIIGEAAALKLVASYGGDTPRIPALRNVSAEHPMAQCIGLEALTALSKVHGGSWLFIAKCYKGMIRRRNANIVRDYSSGVSVSALVRKYGPCDRQIWNILGSTVVDDRQTALF